MRWCENAVLGTDASRRALNAFEVRVGLVDRGQLRRVLRVGARHQVSELLIGLLERLPELALVGIRTRREVLRFGTETRLDRLQVLRVDHAVRRHAPADLALNDGVECFLLLRWKARNHAAQTGHLVDEVGFQSVRA